MSANSDFGLELLNRLYGEQVNTKEDVLILLIHWYFIKNGFKCIGLGDSRTFSSSERGSELLPEGWNQETNYKLRYLKENKLYLVIGTKSDADLLINFMKVDDTASTSILLSPNDIVKELRGSLDKLIPNYSEILDRVKNELLDPVYSGDSKNISTQTVTTPTNRPDYPDNDPLRVPIRPTYQPESRFPTPLRPGVGYDDLNPLGRIGGGGMLFDPFGERRNIPPDSSFVGVPGRIPPGSVPAGARFDPFGPPRTGIPPLRRNPDDDHLPPPGYDYMFM